MIDKPDDQGSWWSNLFGSRPKSEPKKPAPAERPAAATPADRAFQRERLSNIYLRRQAVCDRLRDIALQTNNTALQEEANRLDELAWKLFTERTNRLGAAGGIDRAGPGGRRTVPAKQASRPDSPGRPDRSGWARRIGVRAGGYTMNRIGFLMLGVCLVGLGCVPPSFMRTERRRRRRRRSSRLRPRPSSPRTASTRRTPATAPTRLREELEHEAAGKRPASGRRELIAIRGMGEPDGRPMASRSAFPGRGAQGRFTTSPPL